MGIIYLNQSQSVAGLGTTTFTVPAATSGIIPVKVECKSTLPLASGLQIVINKNGSPVVTSGGAAANPSPTQLSLGAVAYMSLVASDAVTVVLSSSAAIDAIPNSVKSVITVAQSE